MKLFYTSLLTLGLLATGASAALISGPGQITATTSLPTSFGSINQIVDGIDLNTDVSPFNGFASGAQGSLSTGLIRFTFDTNYIFDQFYLANDINVSAEGVRTFRLSFRDGSDEQVYETAIFTASSQIAEQVYSFPAVTDATSVIMEILSSSNRLEIREVAFNSTAVPETSTALLGVLGAICIMVRRRR